MLFKRYLEEQPSEMQKVVRSTSLSTKSQFQAFGTRKPPWRRTPQTQPLKTWKRTLRWEISVPRRTWQTIVQENCSQESEKFLCSSFKCEVITNCGSRIKGLTIATSETQKSSRSFDEPLTTLILFLQSNARSALIELYPANSAASFCAFDHVYCNCSVTLKTACNNAVQKSTSEENQGYKRIFIEESDPKWSEKVFNSLNLFVKAPTL